MKTKSNTALLAAAIASLLSQLVLSPAAHAQETAQINGNTQPYTLVDAKFEDGIKGKAIHVTGPAGYAVVPATADMVQTASFTLEALVRLDDAGSGSDIIAVRRGAKSQAWQFWCNQRGQTCFVAFNNATASAGSATSEQKLNFGEWYHVCVSVDANNNVKLYIDGNPAGGSTLTDPVNTSPASAISLQVAGSGIDSRIFPGLVGDVRFYEGVITDQRLAEVQKLTAGWHGAK